MIAAAMGRKGCEFMREHEFYIYTQKRPQGTKKLGLHTIQMRQWASKFLSPLIVYTSNLLYVCIRPRLQS